MSMDDFLFVFIMIATMREALCVPVCISLCVVCTLVCLLQLSTLEINYDSLLPQHFPVSNSKTRRLRIEVDNGISARAFNSINHLCVHSNAYSQS